MQTIKTLEGKIRLILEKFPETRNDDIALQFRLIEKYGTPYDIRPAAIFSDCYVRVGALRLFREDNVKRVRAKIQNEDFDFLPTDPEVRRKRKILQEDWARYTRKIDGGNPAFM